MPGMKYSTPMKKKKATKASKKKKPMNRGRMGGRSLRRV